MKKQVMINSNYLNLEECDKEIIEIIISKYMNTIDNIINDRVTGEFLCEEFILVISELYDVLLDKEKWLENAYKVLQRLNKKILSGAYFGEIGYMQGICYAGFAVHLLVKKSGKFEKYVNSLDLYIKEEIEKVLEKCENEKKELETSDYDLIYGLTGAGIYLLQVKEKRDTKRLIDKIINYLGKLICGQHLNGKYYVPDWYISKNNHLLEEDKNYYKNGSLNFGLSHGIASIYVLFCYAYKQEYRCDVIEKSLEIIEKNYKRYEKIIDDIIYYPGRLKLEEYQTEHYEFTNYRQSWCYGTIGVNGAFLHAAEAVKNISVKNIMYDNIIKIATLESKKYELASPIVCHGYAGILEIFLSAYKLKEDPVLLGKIKEIVNILLDKYDDSSVYGYKDLTVLKENNTWKMVELDNNTFLEGACGIFLVLYGTLIEETEFQKLLLL